MNENFLDWAKEQLDEKAIVTKERHGDQSDVFKIETLGKNYFLKIGKDLKKERERLEWLKGKVPVPEVVDFIRFENKEALILSAIEGKNLAVMKNKWSAEKVVDKLIEVIKNFHAVDSKDCPFGELKSGNVLVHGDACLPNFIFNGDNFSGYIDVGDMRVDNPEVDFAASIWSLEYNLGKGYGLRFLKQYGIKDATEQLVEELRLKYEDMQKEWRL